MLVNNENPNNQQPISGAGIGNSISLGSITPPDLDNNVTKASNNVNPEVKTPLNSPVDNVESLEPVNANQETANPNPNNDNVVLPVSNNQDNNVGIDPINNVNVNGFVEPPKKENIGTMPPEDKSPKKVKHKGLFIIFILILMAGVAFGVYYLLKLSKNQIKVVLKENIVIPLGEKIPVDINEYATITGTESNNCTLITTNINNNKIGKYEYSINCAKKSYSGFVEVKDQTAPKIALKVVYKSLTDNNEIKAKDFITSCIDPSECQYKFKDKQQLDKETGGPYEIDIDVSDNQNNLTSVKGILYVIPYNIRAILAFSSPQEQITNYEGTKFITDEIITAQTDAGIIYMNVSRREHVYKFTNEKQYHEVIGNKDTTISFDGQTGLASYDDEKLTLKISNDLPKETLNNEVGGEFPTDFPTIKKYYTETKNYTLEIR